jgi:hypothetical protein
MKARTLKSVLMCSLLLFCAASFANAAPQCNIVSSSIPWDKDNQGTWVSNTYQLTIQCTDNNVAVVGYQAKFDIALMKGTDWRNPDNKIATLTTYSTPTDSDGFAKIIVPLIHLSLSGGEFVHICPFDDIQCNGGVSASQAAPLTSSRTASFTTLADPGCLNAVPGYGCCETTITVTCCNPTRSFTYCSNVPSSAQCPTGTTTTPDGCTTIKTKYAPGGICDYCTGMCDISTLITLSSFTAKASNGRVKLEWVTEAEIDNVGFNIYRSESENAGYEKINPELIAAKGSEIKGAKYVFTDNIAKNRKTYFYKLEDIDKYGTKTMHGPKSATPRLILGILGK